MERFIGTWKLVSVEERRPDGRLEYPYGPRPAGILIYDAAGLMSVQIMRADRTALSSTDWDDIDAEEIKAAARDFTAFFGTYEVRESEGVVIHHVRGHLLPNSVGKQLRRSYEFSANRLILGPTPNRRITWERVL
jgi:lipocalin-like protein